MHTLSHHLQVGLGSVMEERLFQSDFLVAFDRVSHSCPLHKLRYIGVKAQYVSIKCCSFLVIEGSAVRLDANVSASVDEVLRVPQCIVLRQLTLFILYNFKLFYILGSYIVGYANDTTIYAVIRTQHSCPQVMKSLNQDLASIEPWCLKWHMRLNSKKAKSIVVN